MSRGLSLTGDDPTDEQLLTKALDYVESKGVFPSFQGFRSDPAQLLSWPRTGVVVDGVEQDSDTIPAGVIAAQCYAAFEAKTQSLVVNNTGQRVLSEKVDSLEVRYSNTSSIRAQPVFGRVEVSLQPFYDYQFGLRNIRI